MGIFLVAFGLRLYRLENNLPPMHGDEGEKGLLALTALLGPGPTTDAQPVPLFGARFFGHPTLYFYMQAVALRLFGESLEALRAMNGFFGALAAALLYFVGRIAWGRWAGFFAGWLMAVSHTYIHYSRTAMSMIPTVFAIVLMVALFAAAHSWARHREAAEPTHPNRLLPFIAIGLTIGWAQHMYYGSRLLPVLAFLLVLYQLLRQQMTWPQLGALIVGFVVIFLPQGYYFLHHPAVWLGRLSGTNGSANGLTAASIQRILGPDALWPNDLPLYLWRQIGTNARYFIDHGDVSSFYWQELPGFDPITVVLLWVGLLLALVRLPRYHEFVAALWFCLGVFLAGVLTIDSPYGPRLLIAMPALFLLAGLTMHLGLVRLQRGHLARRLTGWLLAAAVVAGTFGFNYEYYFVRYAQKGPIYVPEVAARAILAQPTALRAYFLTAPHFYQTHGDLRFLTRKTERFDLQSLEEFEQIERQWPTTKARLFLVIPERQAELAAYRTRFPGGVEQEMVDHYNNVRLISYLVPPP
jgi:uncharacterized membrane protein